MSDVDKIDLSPFAAMPLDDLRQAIDARCAPLLAERRARRATIQIVAWWRPAIAAAVLISAASLVVLTKGPPRRTAIAVAPSSIRARSIPNPRIQLAMLLGVPRPLVNRVARPAPPTLNDLLQEV